ncbi:ABC transporter substrate-binding protein [Sporanaerobium hydrogeniformans]|uniref:ABC transporter substrate-binding protein n=1 Tax=Sporanaerobium hydrogeniformans TaxID=3072179 RepID=UPI0015D4ABCA|nr:extracellular solute-binding protein [Sporanaerobium hydrogeniformans]
MRKKHILFLTGSILGIIFIFIYYLSGSTKIKKEMNVKSLDSVQQKTKLQFISSWASYDTKSQPLQQLLKEFTQTHSDVEIEDKSMAGEDFLFILKTDFASGNPPHVFGLWPGSDIRLLVQKGEVADLTGLLKANPDWYNLYREATWDYVTEDGRIYGIPLEIIYEGLFINKDLFLAYDVKPPTNFEELLEAVKIFKAHDIVPIAYNATPEGSYIYQNIVMKLGGKEDVENPFYPDGSIKQCFIDGMYYMKALYEAGAFPEKTLLLDDKTRNDLFIQKEAAMIVQGSWFIGDSALSNYDTTVDIIPFPSLEGGKADPTAIIYGCGNGIFHISQKAWEDEKLREKSIALLKKLTSKEASDIFTERTGFITNIQLTSEQKDKASMTQKGDKLMETAKELVGPVDSFIDRVIWEEVIIGQFTQMLNGEITPEEIYEQVKKEMQNKTVQ